MGQGDAMVLAGPGCGKTHILARRIFHANLAQGIPFGQMLCLTFTNRAAREMKDRIKACFGYAPKGLFVGNIHRFCLKFLFANHLIDPETNILDETERDIYLADNLGLKTPMDRKNFRDANNYFFETENKFPPHLIRHIRQAITPNLHDKVKKYTAFKKENNYIDFDDILLLAYRALLYRNHSGLVMTSYTWVQLDEVQDITPLQIAIVNQVCKPGQRTALFLGDEQQAIFSFIGAGGRAMDSIKQLCGGKIFFLQKNYRSSQGLVDLCNALAYNWLGIDCSLLPQAVSANSGKPIEFYYVEPRYNTIVAAARARELLNERPDKSVAILVNTNREGNEMANYLRSRNFDFIHISNKDIFHCVDFKTIWSHLYIAVNPVNATEWARILFQTNCISTLGKARQIMWEYRKAAISGDDLINIGRKTTIQRFVQAMHQQQRPIVVFDTETTGLDIFNDDIIQIAAYKISNGEIVPGSHFEVFIRTDKEIPRFLSNGLDNPMYRLYHETEKLKPTEAFRQFLEYSEGCVFAGHNCEFDIPVLAYNIARNSIELKFDANTECIDSLTVSRLLLPHLWSHTLENLINYLHIDGCNTHNASDDALATAKLLISLCPLAEEKIPFINNITASKDFIRLGSKINEKYGELYFQTRQALINPEADILNSLAAEMIKAHVYFSEKRFINIIPHFNYIIDLVEKVVVNTAEEPTFRDQITAHLHDLLTFNESDLFANDIIEEKLSVMTIHKAKGMEMDNVIVYNASGGFGSLTEKARVLYVAFSRARYRLIIGCSSAPGPILESIFPKLTPLTQQEIQALIHIENQYR